MRGTAGGEVSFSWRDSMGRTKGRESRSLVLKESPRRSGESVAGEEGH